MTLTPMMCAKLLKPEKKRKHGIIYSVSEGMFTRLHSVYRITLSWALQHSRIMLVITLVTVGVNVVLFAIVPKGFFPEQDTGLI
ncbi:efflux RND transporter permease subunit, partial [Streptococcus suis]